MALNTASDVRRVLHLDSSNEVLTDLEIDSYLTDANTELFTTIKKRNETNFFRVLRDKDGNIVNSYDLLLAPVISITKVLKNNSVVASTDYSVDNDTGEIVFNSGVLSDGDELEVLYVPELYKQAELYLCAYNINLATNILSRGGDLSPIAENLERKKDELINTIQSVLKFQRWQ